jgi:hypothetical protein
MHVVENKTDCAACITNSVLFCCCQNIKNEFLWVFETHVVIRLNPAKNVTLYI